MMEIVLGVPGTIGAYSWADGDHEYMGATDNENATLYGKIQGVTALLAGAGIPKSIIMYCVAQALHESNMGSSSIARNLNNLTGIKYLGNAKQDATQGTMSPEGNYYARFTTPSKWATDYKRILSIKGPFGAPIDATNVTEFLKRLRANKYFTDPNYEAAYNRSFNAISNAVKWYNSGGANKSIKIEYTGGPGSPTKKIETITPNTEVVKYSTDPTGRVDKDGNPKGLEIFPDVQFGFGSWAEFENWAKNNPIKTAIILAVAALGLRKIFK